ncbi:hypothetical protein [Oceanobacillus massiliensis]|uniref:hypothetical protein n=1 Tax=Oceanobacillus massiliensis TaxID=1465765 RepID=UPI00031883B4|nr:hypothetical protein [Oceanobacillus massiliensis]
MKCKDDIFAVDWNYQVEGVPNLGVWAKENNSKIFEEVVVKRGVSSMIIFFYG